MALTNFLSSSKNDEKTNDYSDEKIGLRDFLEGFSIEVMPRTAEKIDDFKAILPPSTRIYIAHIEGTPIEDMVRTAKRLTGEGFDVMPHFPARIIKDTATLAEWIARYQSEAGIEQALLLAGGVAKPHGVFSNSMQLLETELFDRAGFRHLHVAGHPEGNKDIDTDGGQENVMKALAWKQAFSERTDADMAIATQFCFEAAPVIAWAEAIAAAGISLPIHIGVAGPAKLQTLLQFSMECGVGASLRVLTRRAKDITRLLLPFEPTDFLVDLVRYRANTPNSNIAKVHIFPLGGIKTAANWLEKYSPPMSPA